MSKSRLSPSANLRRLIAEKDFLYMPSVYDPIGGKLVESLGIDVAYVGGYVTGGSLVLSEPLVTMTEQVAVAAGVARAASVPVIADAGAGFGEPLHCMRMVREFIRADVAGIHIEDQLYPKRAHYHKYVAHAVPAKEYVDKIDYACRQREESDPDFVIIARTDVCRFEGVDAALERIRMAADVGADMGLLFPRDLEEATRAPKESPVPLVYVQSRGNRDGRPLFNLNQLRDMGYKACIDAQICLLVAHHFVRKALESVRDTGDYDGLTQADFTRLRQDVEDLIGLEGFYEIEEQTVETEKWGKR